jgi:predicted nucleic acid-binding Zn ribbon protein
MPMPFHCIECNKPIQQALRGICDECKDKDEEE